VGGHTLVSSEMPRAYNRPRSVRASRSSVVAPYPASHTIRAGGSPSSSSVSISSRAICHFLTLEARWRYRARKLFARAGCSPADDYHYRPKGMHWRTFNRLLDQADSYEGAAAGLALCGVFKFLEEYHSKLSSALARSA
jgi:hypothetical protein